MNYLAHFHLSNNDKNLIIGNYIADDVKGKAYLNYPTEIQHGIILHRKIDAFTDTHQIVINSKKHTLKKGEKVPELRIQNKEGDKFQYLLCCTAVVALVSAAIMATRPDRMITTTCWCWSSSSRIAYLPTSETRSAPSPGNPQRAPAPSPIP